MSKGIEILPKEAVQDKPVCSQMTLEVKHSGVENHSHGIVSWKHNDGALGCGQYNHIQTSVVCQNKR